MLLTHTAIQKSRTAFILMLLVLIGGVSSYIALPRETSPEVVVPYFQVFARYPGAAPQTIENLLALPLEKEISNVDGIKNIFTTCLFGTAVITVEFDVSVDLNKAFQDVKDAVDKAERDLPSDMENAPTVTELNFNDRDIVTLSINGDAPRVTLQAIADDLKDYIENVRGVREVQVGGEVQYELELTVDPAKLALYNISLPGIVQTFTGENEDRPGGSIDMGSGRYNITVPGQFDSLDDVSNLILTVRGDNPIYLRDIAEVRMRESERSSLARVNGNDSITLGVRNRPGSDVIQIARSVNAIVEEGRKQIPPTVSLDITYDESEQIMLMLDDLESAVVTGFLFLAVIILLFLGWRNSLFVGIAIPFSLLLSFIVVSSIGYTLNMMVMASTIVALGMLVDNAIVIVENGYRHMEEGLSARAAVEMAINEVGWPIITSTLTTVCAFLPLAFWPGIMGSFFISFPVTLIVILTASLLVALVVNPVICSHLMKLRKNRKASQDEEWLPAVVYKRILPFFLDKTPFVLVGLPIYFIGSIALFGVFGKGSILMPPSDQPSYLSIRIDTPPGSSLDHNDFYARQAEAAAMEYEDAASVVVNVNNSGATVNLNFVEYRKMVRDPMEITRELRERFSRISGARINIDAPSMGPPVSEGVTIEIKGTDLESLKESVAITEGILADIRGTEDIANNMTSGEPEFLLEIDRDKALIMGVPTNVIATTVRSYTDGFTIGAYNFSADEDIDVVARLPEERIETITDLQTLMIPSSKGGQVPLSSVTNIVLAGSSGDIQRQNQERVASVTAVNVGRNSNEIVAEFFKRAAEANYPDGYAPEAGGELDFEQETSSFFVRAFVIAVFLIFVILVAQFNSFAQSVIVMTSVALSSAGVILSLVLMRSPFVILMNGIAIISLAGVAVNNAIVMIDYINQLRREGVERREAVIRAGCVRLRPVLLTALTTIAGMIPMAVGVSINVRTLSLSVDTPTGEWWKPMGQAMIAGLFFATFLTLIIVPVLYNLFEGIKERRRSS